MKQRRYIKVVAGLLEGADGSRLESQISRGILPLKRGQSVLDFVTEFLANRGISSFSLHQRGEDTWATSPIMFLDKSPKQVLTFSFIVFSQEDLGYHAKDLTPEELERDMKIIQKLLH